jgi:hypothetical protein
MQNHIKLSDGKQNYLKLDDEMEGARKKKKIDLLEEAKSYKFSRFYLSKTKTPSSSQQGII